ncbi:MAG: hypothetical protein JXR36_03805 [Bacteroidales bacterium]|nr:hypothetical protein [Bacteroidales bacterium]
MNEQVSNDTLRDMKAFGLTRNDIDNDGYVTLYHGGKELPERLKEDEIFFTTSSYDEALDYAKMRKGDVFEIKVRPEDVNWNQGSYEVEFDKGGLIRDGKIIPQIKDKNFKANPFNEIKNSYNGYGNISDELFKWVERTLNYYVSTKKMTPNESYKQLIDDIDYYYMMDEENNNFLEFVEILKYSDANKLSKDLSDLSSLDFNEVFYKI